MELGDEYITYFKGIIFSLAVIGVVGCLFATRYTHSFSGRIKGMLTGVLTGYFVSVFALEFLRELLTDWLEDQTAIFDFSYDLLDWEGLFLLTLKFSSDPEGAYAMLRKALVPAILVILWVVLWCAFQGLAKALGKILGAFVKWLSIKTPREGSQAT